MTAIFQKGRPERFIIFVLLLTRPALFLMSLNHISRPHKCPLPTDGGTLVMTAHCSITIWSNFSVNSKWFSPNPHIIHNHIITICKQCNVCAKKCLDRKVAYKFGPKIFSSAMALVQLGLSLNKVRRCCILKADSFSPILIVRPVSYLISPATLFMFAYYRRNNYCCARISVFQT